MKRIATAFLSLLIFWSVQAFPKSGLEFLQEATPPVFREGHTLLPLTRWAWPLRFEMNVELAERWGYAIDIYPGVTGEELNKSNSLASHTVAFLKASQRAYPVSVTTRRVVFEPDTIKSLLSPVAWCRDGSGNLILRNSHPVMKPYINDADAAAMGTAEVARLQRLRDAGVKVSVILNGAEYMPGVPGHEKTFWRQDPEVSAWLDSVASLTPNEKVDAYASNKAKQEQAIRDAVLNVMPGSEMVYYVTGDMRRGIVSEEARVGWAYPYRHMIHGSTIPSWEFYYGYFGSWMPNSAKESLPLLATNSAAQGIEDGRPLSYNWLSAGWSLTDTSRVSEDSRYLGFLKFLYTLGSVGNVAGYFTYPPGGFNDDLGSSAPDWLRQIMLLSHTHATFTHLEDFLREGDLLPGDGSHPYSVDLYGKASWPHPSYEFRTNEGGQSVHVAARKLRLKNEWLIVAWAAEGADRNVSVSIPELGSVNLLARADGSLYLAKPGPSLTLLDPVGMDPSRNVAGLLRAVREPAPTRQPQPGELTQKYLAPTPKPGPATTAATTQATPKPPPTTAATTEAAPKPPPTTAATTQATPKPPPTRKGRLTESRIVRALEQVKEACGEPACRNRTAPRGEGRSGGSVSADIRRRLENVD